MRGLGDPEPRVPYPKHWRASSGEGWSRDTLSGLRREFQTQLRTVLNQLSADAVASAADAMDPQAPARLQMRVSREVARGRYEVVTGAPPGRVPSTRDIKRVPRPPERVPLRTSDRLMLDVIPDLDGYVTVFNIGPTGNLDLLPTESPDTTLVIVPAGSTLSILEEHCESEL